MFEGFKGPYELIKVEDQIKMKQKYTLADDFQGICPFLIGLRAQLIHFGHLILFLTHHSESQIMFEGFKCPSEVIEAEDQVKIKLK